MAALDKWIVESQARCQARSQKEGCPDAFRKGSWWCAYQIEGQVPWANMRGVNGLYNWLGDAFVKLAEPMVFKSYSEPLQLDDIWECWVPSPHTRQFWRFSHDGRAYCTGSLAEDCDPGRQPGSTLDYVPPVVVARDTLRHVTAMSMHDSRFQLQVGWLGLSGRKMVDHSKGVLSDFAGRPEIALPLEGKCSELVTNNDLAGLVSQFVKPLYVSFGISWFDETKTRQILAEIS